MGDVNSERARHEARESVGNRPPREGESRTEAAMRRYLGAEMFDELHRPEKKAQGKAAKPGPAAEPEEPSPETGEKG
jgi:hypothetical protein